jgi:hypothetical protein
MTTLQIKNQMVADRIPLRMARRKATYLSPRNLAKADS